MREDKGCIKRYSLFRKNYYFNIFSRFAEIKKVFMRGGEIDDHLLSSFDNNYISF